jgi:hypothetical protein
MDGRHTNSEGNFNMQPKKTTQHRAPTVKVEEPTYLKRTEEVNHGLIHEEEDDDDIY